MGRGAVSFASRGRPWGGFNSLSGFVDALDISKVRIGLPWPIYHLLDLTAPHGKSAWSFEGRTQEL